MGYKQHISYTFTLLRLLTLSWHAYKHIREGQLKYQRVVATCVVLTQELLMVLCQSGRCVEWQGSALRQLLLSIFFHELDDRIAKKLLFLMLVGLQKCLWTGLEQNA